MTDPIVIKLDRERAIAWTLRARARLDSLPRVRTAGPYYQLCARVWAMLVDRAHDFADPEDLAEYLATPEQVNAVGEAVLRALKGAEDSPKNGKSSPAKRGPSSS